MSLFVDAILFRRRWVIEIADTRMPWDDRIEMMRVSLFVSILLGLIIRNQSKIFQDRYIIQSRYEPST